MGQVFTGIKAAVEMRKGDWLQTYSGVQYWPCDPRAEEVNIVDIAHALSQLCRYGGHSKRFYSVAEHSVLLSHMVSPENAFAALMHDATEAYVVDVPRPIKPHLKNYAHIEWLNWGAIAHKFDLPFDIPQEVHDADKAICGLEVEQVMLLKLRPQYDFDRPVKIRFLNPVQAEVEFISRFLRLCGTGKVYAQAITTMEKLANDLTH